MKKRSSAPARISAVLALVLAFVLAIAVVGGAFDSGDSDGSNGNRGGDNSGQNAERPKRKLPAVYVIESGDTLIAIASRMGISVARIEALNPEVDPQILVAGEELKLR
jgi:LysM repeat protein